MDRKNPDGHQTLFISWIRWHGRSSGLARDLGADCHFIDPGPGNVVLRYLRAIRKTRHLVRGSKFTSVIVMQPPLPALVAVCLFTRRKTTSVVGDLHTGAFEDPKWRWSTNLALALIRRRGFAIVTNESLAARARKRGAQAVVVHDAIDSPAGAPHGETSESGHVLVPLSYANDEPIAQILGAAATLPRVPFVLTGRAPDAVVQSAPSNVAFAGYVSDERYNELLHGAAAVLALTTRKHTMQRAGYEAMSARRPLITSDFPELRAFFEDGARYCGPDEAEIAREISSALRDSTQLSGRMDDLAAQRLAEYRAAISAVSELLVSRE